VLEWVEYCIVDSIVDIVIDNGYWLICRLYYGSIDYYIGDSVIVFICIECIGTDVTSDSICIGINMDIEKVFWLEN
jgi:hypothetical protein